MMSFMNLEASSFLFIVLVASSLINTSSQQSIFGINVPQTVECFKKITSALGTCEQVLQDRLDLVDKASEQTGDKVDKTMFSCCYFAEFSHCLDSKTEGKCGKDISSAIASGASSVAKVLNSKCEEYEYYSAKCLFVVYLNYIVVIAIILAVISVASCVIGCLRRR
ncbi:uncharacterized protein LOC128396556 [Panonychus citri]|uniref:uncharacterized protein LOC128396556 n=1 Tax=Panonychus citri TaxID=50023 RepID=UPI002306DE6A|nr:uncharacterized protein LOC128396556 [Panonychus citri]XP_053213133.1 uncharacterized protein LOC128396556 [Panonychus citri]